MNRFVAATIITRKGFAQCDKQPGYPVLSAMNLNTGTLQARLVWTAARTAHIIRNNKPMNKASMKQSMTIPMSEITGLTRNTAEKNFLYPFLLALSLAFASTGASIAAEPDAPAKVDVYAKHVGNKVVYHYRVTNNSPMNITAVSIGYDTKNDGDPGNDVWELSELPSGWNIKYGIPSASSNSPTYWRVSMAKPSEESSAHAITWEVANEKSPALYSGQTLTKMSVALDKADASYLTGHALVTFSESTTAAKSAPAATKTNPPAIAKDSLAATTKSPPLNISVSIVPLDTRPPILAVTLTPSAIWSTENKHMPVNAAFTTKEDDYDNLPEIKLESITANEPLEPDDILDASYGLDDRHLRFRAKHNGITDRVYTVTYSATDASGNQTTASATLTVTATAPAASAVSAVPAAPTVAPAAPATAPQGQGGKKARSQVDKM